MTEFHVPVPQLSLFLIYIKVGVYCQLFVQQVDLVLILLGVSLQLVLQQQRCQSDWLLLPPLANDP